MPITSIKDLDIYKIAYRLAMEVFELTKIFPKEERYNLTDQIRRSSRSVSMNIREGFAKRFYEQIFVRHLIDAQGSAEETRGWLDFALDCEYIPQEQHDRIDKEYDNLQGMVYNLQKKWRNYKKK